MFRFFYLEAVKIVHSILFSVLFRMISEKRKVNENGIYTKEKQIICSCLHL